MKNKTIKKALNCLIIVNMIMIFSSVCVGLFNVPETSAAEAPMISESRCGEQVEHKSNHHKTVISASADQSKVSPCCVKNNEQNIPEATSASIFQVSLQNIFILSTLALDIHNSFQYSIQDYHLPPPAREALTTIIIRV